MMQPTRIKNLFSSVTGVQDTRTFVPSPSCCQAHGIMLPRCPTASQFLEVELKNSYSTKNFTLKKELLELEKQYRAHIAGNEAMAALLSDVSTLLVRRGRGRG